MLSGIASLLFGTPATQEADPAADVNECNLKTRPAENDEWEIVDTSSRHGSPVRSSFGSCRTNAAFVTPVQCAGYGDQLTSSTSSDEAGASCARRRGPRISVSYDSGSEKCHSSDTDTALSDISSIPEPVFNPSLEESWLVTPPPCFTAGGSSPQRMETNPMENLLIEHPSMSVYGQRGRPASTGIDSESSDASRDEEPMEVRPPVGPVNHHRAPRRPLAVAARAGLLVHAPSVKSMQVSQQKQNSRKLGKKRMQRSNKVTQYESSNKHQRRKHYALRSSGVNNNRKCY